MALVGDTGHRASSVYQHLYLNINPHGDLDLRAFDLESGSLYFALPRPAYSFVTHLTGNCTLERERERERACITHAAIRAPSVYQV